MKKQFPPFLAAFLITGFIALAMAVTSANALLNKSGTTVANDPAAVASAASVEQAQVLQLQVRVSEYQQRETQYQQLLQSNQDQIKQAQVQIQQYQQFLFALQQAGVIQIRSDGTVLITGGRSGNN